MDGDDLKEYLNIVVNMEKNIYLQNSLISHMQNRIKQLGQIHTYQEPVIPIKKSSNWFSIIVFSGVFFLIGFLIFQWGLKLCYSITENGLALLYGPIVLLFGVVLILGTIISTIVMLVDNLKDINSYNKAKSIYSIAYEEYKKNIQADKERVCKELLEQKALLLVLKPLQKQNVKSKQNLEKIYSKNIIFSKYRNLVMVCSLYEYICSGRCGALEGHEGAYNILEFEIRLNHIIIQLEQVIAKLDSIQNNQFILYSAIQDTNQQAKQILKSTNSVINDMQNNRRLELGINSVPQKTALSAFITQCKHIELQYINQADYLCNKYNNIF